MRGAPLLAEHGEGGHTVRSSTMTQLTREERSILLDEAIAECTRAGYRLVSRGETSAQLMKPKEPIDCWTAGCAILLFPVGVGILLLILLLLARRDELVFVQVSPSGEISGLDSDLEAELFKCPSCSASGQVRRFCEKCGAKLREAPLWSTQREGWPPTEPQRLDRGAQSAGTRWPKSSTPGSADGARTPQATSQQGRSLPANRRTVIALLGVAVIGVFGCLCCLLATDTSPTGDQPAQTTLDQPTASITVTVPETPTVAESRTLEASPTFTLVVEVMPTPTSEVAVEETRTSEPSVDSTELWLQHWDRPGSTLDPEGWFSVIGMTWDAIESAVDSGDRQGACGYSVLFKVQEAEDALNAAPPPGQLQAAADYLQRCLEHWEAAARTLLDECHGRSGLPLLFRADAERGHAALQSAREEIERHR